MVEWNSHAVLRDHQLTVCSVSFPKLPEEIIFTTSNVYVRIHGVTELFKSAYSDEELKSLKERLPLDVKNIFIYFNNTTFDAGYTNSRTMGMPTGSKLIHSLPA